MGKRGQVTLFIIIGIVIVVVIALFLIVGRSSGNETTLGEKISSDTEAIYDFTQDCVEQVGEDSLVLIAKQGGNYKEHQDVVKVGSLNIAKFYSSYGGGPPSDGKIIDEINLYFRDNFLNCVNYFQEFKTEGYTINYGDIFVNVNYYEDSTLLKVDFPLKIKKGNEEVNYNQFEYKSDIPFLNLYNKAVGQVRALLDSGVEWGLDTGIENGPDRCMLVDRDRMCKVTAGGYEFNYAI
ncbi:MAG: hypothetical protein PHG05_01230 [Candidatus Nanoarchaeia archaeon]|nr:hypothetical protein [Candidatus Nanoarchaeia archaeon]